MGPGGAGHGKEHVPHCIPVRHISHYSTEYPARYGTPLRLSTEVAATETPAATAAQLLRDCNGTATDSALPDESSRQPSPLPVTTHAQSNRGPRFTLPLQPHVALECYHKHGNCCLDLPLSGLPAGRFYASCQHNINP